MMRYNLYLAWLISAVATLASLYQSGILGHLPCTLCWYQRVFLFPLPLLLFPIVYHRKKEFVSYILSLPLLGLFVALYQLSITSKTYLDFTHPIFGAITFSSILLLLLFFKR